MLTLTVNYFNLFFFQNDHIKLSTKESILMHSDDIHNIFTFENIFILNCYTKFSYDTHL